MKIEIKDMPMVFQMTNKTDIHPLLVLDWCRLLNGDAKIYVYKWFFLKKHSFFIYNLRLYWYFIMKIIIKIKRSTGTNSSNNNISCTYFMVESWHFVILYLNFIIGEWRKLDSSIYYAISYHYIIVEFSKSRFLFILF